MVELVRFLVESLVDDKEAVVITKSEDVIQISVSRPDMGKIIGRQGKIAKAIRTVVKAAGIKNGTKCTVEILEADENFQKNGASKSESASDDKSNAANEAVNNDESVESDDTAATDECFDENDD